MRRFGMLAIALVFGFALAACATTGSDKPTDDNVAHNGGESPDTVKSDKTDPKPDTERQSTKEVIFVLGVNGMD